MSSSTRLLETPTPSFGGRSRLLRVSVRSVLTSSLIAAMGIASCYSAYAWKLDQDSRSLMKALDFPSEAHERLLGKKGFTAWGALERRSTSAQCGDLYSNHGVCSANVVLHTNCIEICDPSYSCNGCAALQAEQTKQAGIAQAHCDTKRDTSCSLNVLPSGKNDYASFSECCLSAAPVGPPSCFCENQQYATSSCFNFGCLADATCETAGSLTCTGTSSSVSPAPNLCDDEGATYCSGHGTDKALVCGIVSGVQWYLQLNSATCAVTCDAGTKARDSSGHYICSAATIYEEDNDSDYFVGCIAGNVLSKGYFAGSNLSPLGCIDACLNGYNGINNVFMDYGGLVSGGDCYCVQDYDKKEAYYVDSDPWQLDNGPGQYGNCNTQCSEDKTYFCGGYGGIATSLYTVDNH